jgi:hypothetical protein
MKNSIYFNLLIGFCMSGPAQADYTIHLENGRKIEAQKHWEQDNQLMLKTPRGVIGVPLRNVSRIEQTPDKTYPEYKYFQKKPEQDLATENSPASPETSKDAAKDSQKAEKHDDAINQYFSDIQSKQPTVFRMSKTQMVDYVKEIDKLMADIHSKKLTKNYADELKTLHDLRGEVEQQYYKEVRSSN